MNRILACVWIIFGVLQFGVGQTYPCDYDIDCSDIDTSLKVNIEYPANLEMDDQFCAEFTVTTFEYIISMQFEIVYDPSVISIDCGNVANINTGNCLVGLSPSNFNCTNGNIRFVYFNNNVEGICCNDGSTIFELCFDVIGEPLDDIVLNIIPDEVGYGLGFDAPDICYAVEDLLCVNTTISEVGCPDLTVIAGFCNSTPGNDDASLHFTACGGVGPYTYDVTQIGTGSVASGTNLNTGDEILVENLILFEQYQITITDANNDSVARIIFFTEEGNQIDILTEIEMEPTCFNRQNGIIDIDVSGGGTSYEYMWSNGEFGSDRIDNLPTGMYSVTVTDETGCSDIADFSLSLDTLKLNYTIIDSASCMGGNNGIIKLSAEGGRPFTTSPDTYLFQSDNTPLDCKILTGLEGGDQLTIRVQDDPQGFCIVTETLEVPYKDGFEVVELLNTGIQCNGDRVATIELFATVVTSITAILQDQNGATITDPNITSTTIGGNIIRLENLLPGTYYVEIEAVAPAEFNGCSILYELVITDPDPLVFTGDFTPPDCGGNPGSIQYTLSGGGGNFDLSLNGAAIPPAQDINLGNNMYEIINLNGGLYQLTVRDDNDCRDTLNFDLPPAGTLPLEIDTVSNLVCGGMDVGALIVRVLGDCDNCDYEWFDSNGNFISGGTQIFELGQGCYTAVVTDNDQMCTNMITACLSQVDGIEYTESLTPPRCAEGTDGTIGIIITQGQVPINYQWADFPAVTGSVIGPIAAGNYCVTITDANMCVVETCIQLDDPDSLSMSIVDIIHVECSGQATGQINVTGLNGFNGTDFYSYIIYDENGMEYTTASGTGTVNIPGIEAGSYTVLVTDGQCAALERISFVIDEPMQLNIDLDNSTLIVPSCYGLCNGQISAVAIGGSGMGYSYSWAATGQVSPNITGLCGDIWHYVDITDSDGCINRDSIFLNQPDTLIALFNPNASDTLRCFGGNTATISINAAGGTPDYDYQWTDNVSITNAATDLEMGTYTVTVTDVFGCEAYLTQTLTSPVPVTADIPTPMDPPCWGETTCIEVSQAFGGTEMGYYYTIVTDGFKYPLDSCAIVLADTFNISVFDSNGCAFDTLMIIGQPDPILVDLGPDIEVTLGDSSAVIQASISAVNPVTIDWTPMDELECIDPNCQIINVFPTSAQSYNVLVTDINGCTAEDDIQVTIGENRNVYVPNVFSPNGDGYNDGFSIYVGEGVKEIEYFGVFDRWGNVMYEFENISAADTAQLKWDGLFKGKEVVPGVYAYRSTISFIDNVEKKYKGTFTLLR